MPLEVRNVDIKQDMNLQPFRGGFYFFGHQRVESLRCRTERNLN